MVHSMLIWAMATMGVSSKIKLCAGLEKFDVIVTVANLALRKHYILG